MNLSNPAGKSKWLRWDIGLIIVSILFAAVMIIVASIRPLTSLEIVLLQILALGAGLSGSFMLGRISAGQAARDVIRPHVRSSLRTNLLLRQSLFRLSRRIDEFNAVDPDHRLQLIQSVVHEQISIGRAAVQDWRDAAPDEDIEAVLNTLTEQAEE